MGRKYVVTEVMVTRPPGPEPLIKIRLTAGQTHDHFFTDKSARELGLAIIALFKSEKQTTK